MAYNSPGISAQHMNKYFRGEAFYAAETDVHFPKLSVGDTLSFAARARAPRKAPGGITIKQYSQHLRDVVMAVFGISHTVNKRVGSDYVRGVSSCPLAMLTLY
jgi:ATP-binding cassette subfamily G (WHITE) protein 2 (PDR)